MFSSVCLDLDKGIHIIQARIIELTNKKIRLRDDLKHYQVRIELGVAPDKVDIETKKIKLIKRELEITDVVLNLNKNLLPFTDEHMYQLEN